MYESALKRINQLRMHIGRFRQRWGATDAECLVSGVASGRPNAVLPFPGRVMIGVGIFRHRITQIFPDVFRY